MYPDCAHGCAHDASERGFDRRLQRQLEAVSGLHLEIELAGCRRGADPNARADGSAFLRCFAIMADRLTGERAGNGGPADVRGVVLDVRATLTQIARGSNVDLGAVRERDRREREGELCGSADPSGGFDLADVNYG